MTHDPTRFLPPPAAASPLGDPRDPTEGIRRLLLEFDAPHHHLVEATQAGDPTWTTEEATALFRFHSFLAPFVSVTRLEDGRKGTLEFTHDPRRYFNFVPEER